MSEDQIRLKNLINKALDILKNRDDRRNLESMLVERAEELLNDRDFWETRTEGLLICARPDVWELFDLPIDTEEYLAVNSRFHLAPMLGLLREAQGYYVLMVAQHQPALLRGDMYDLHPTDIKLPETVEAGLNIDEMNQKSEQQRSAVGSNMNPSGFNGRGGSKNPAEEERQRFWRMLDQIICTKANKKLPLILAGVESEIVEYKDISHYPKILSGSIKGNFISANSHDLFEAAWRIIKDEIIDTEHAAALDNYLRLKGENEGRTGDSFAAITDAADKGRVSTLLVGMNRITSDTVRDNTQPVPVIVFPGTEESTEAIHDTALSVWSQGGAVINMEQSRMPGGAAMAAIFRY